MESIREKEIDFDFEDEIRKLNYQEAKKLFKMKRMEFLELNPLDIQVEKVEDSNKKSLKDVCLEIEILKVMLMNIQHDNGNGTKVNRRGSLANFLENNSDENMEVKEILNQVMTIVETKMDKADLPKYYNEIDKLNKKIDKLNATFIKREEVFEFFEDSE